MKITFRGLPWHCVSDWASSLEKTKGQTFGWNPFSVKGMGRYGGGWAFKFGIMVDRRCSDMVVSFGLGECRIKFNTKD